MKIRWKLLILLSAISLIPMTLGVALHRAWMRGLGRHLAGDVRQVLTAGAQNHLRVLVDGYRRAMVRDKAALEFALRVQADGVEARLRGPPARSPRIIFARDIDAGTAVPDGMQTTDLHTEAGPDGRRRPMRVSYRDQVYYLAPGADEGAVAGDLARLSAMPQTYRLVHGMRPDLLLWQYTSLSSGLHTSYPAHGGYPPEYDPRKRQWYADAWDAGGLVWTHVVDVTTREAILTVSMPVRGADGSPAGVTAMDVPITEVFRELRLPEAWAAEATALLVAPGTPGTDAAGQLWILARDSGGGIRQGWEMPPRPQALQSEAPSRLAALKACAEAGQCSVLTMPYRGREAFWAHGASEGGQPFPVVIVPCDRIVARAEEAENYVLAKTAEGLKITGVILLAVVAAVAAVAFLASRAVTRPVARLAEAAEKLSGGDYASRVDIRTRDEFQQLARAFNEMGPKLAERERMKRSLALAMEVQQNLLPREPPRVVGFDVAGGSVYCDETGGDYYDFIDLVDLGGGKLGIAVGDVSGHGIEAALLMASARGVLRSHAGLLGTDLAKLFAAMNRHLTRDSGDERFMTLFYAVLDAEARTLRWTSAGHDPALWLRRSTGEIEELPNTGMALGVLEEADFAQAGPVRIDPGDTVLIGTDGIWETRNPAGEFFGKQRLRDLVAALTDRCAEEIRQAVVDAVAAFRQVRPQEDDVTLVVIRGL